MAGDPEHGGVGVLNQGNGMASADWMVARDGAHGSRDLELSQSSCGKLDQVVQASFRTAARLVGLRVLGRFGGALLCCRKTETTKRPDVVLFLSYHAAFHIPHLSLFLSLSQGFQESASKQGAAKQRIVPSGSVGFLTRVLA
jgi:hypothetical protein